MAAETLRDNLRKLVDEFDDLAIPDYGKYVNNNK
ncbi:hypothetical protein J2S25_001343 [Mesobacillus stamsii]|uniref:Uncharacterized protein n=1 Tax=Mesobacillus stamsii TaxID=225347 RepID=A0ABU0FTR6_9BACI|nr:hypothetical protein [Mesobacillus stamsii]